MSVKVLTYKAGTGIMTTGTHSAYSSLLPAQKTADAPLNGDTEQEVEMHYSAMLQQTIKHSSPSELLRQAV